jgi:hypothetical protein
MLCPLEFLPVQRSIRQFEQNPLTLNCLGSIATDHLARCSIVICSNRFPDWDAEHQMDSLR